MTQPPQDPFGPGGIGLPPTPGHSVPQPQQQYPQQGHPAPYPQQGHPAPYPYPYPPQGHSPYHPPQYPPYAQDRPVPRPAFGLAMWAIVTASLVAIYEIAQAFVAFHSEEEYVEAVERGRSTVDIYTPYDDIFGIVVLALIPAYVLGCVWLQRLRTNARVLEPHRRQVLANGWVWGGWVVPIVNFWFPLLIVLDASRDPRTGKSPGGLLASWWTAWVLASITTIAGTIVVGSDEVAAIETLGVVESVHAVVVVVALALWAAVVIRLSRAQERLLGLRR